MTFESRITRTPIPHNHDRGAEAAELIPTSGALRDVVVGAGGCSPYLLGLMAREQDWIGGALDGAPEDALAQEFVRLAALPPDQVKSGLRQGKRRVALLLGLADLGGVFTLEQVTGQLSAFADLAVARALDTALRHELRRKKLPGMGEDDLATGCGMVTLAMGKMGAGELNYSSDIDLICLFDETRFDADTYHDARASLIRATRNMAALLSDITGDGYVFRTDLRLRPDPSVTPVCLSMEAAERYYESVGRTWERAAHIKARPCAGDLAAGEAYLDRLAPFIWRKHLDFAAIEDAHDMRLRIRDHKGLGGEIDLAGHNMKLGRGGIREIEFFTQTRQIIAGGRDASLRERGTLAGLAALVATDWVPAEVAARLADHYGAHRQIEHRLQMVNDAQTHDLPSSDRGFDRLAAMLGHGDVAALKRDLNRRLNEVHTLTESFFAPGNSDPALDTAPDLSPTAEQITSRWPTYAALRSLRAREVFDRLRPEILSRMQNAARPDEALVQFDGFLAGLPAGVQLFSLFEANPHLIDLLVDICATAPALARHLSRNAKVLDAVIGGSFFDDWPGQAALRDQLLQMMATVDDYEARLDTARRFMQEWHFCVGVHHLRGLVDGAEAGQHYADLAEAVVGALWPQVLAEFARKHGPPPGRGAVVLAMGSLGAGRLSARSDLDLIVIYDGHGADGVAIEASDGKRPLSTRPYYARLTQALVTALTAPMAEGRLYEVDMRLRPSGRQGPVATALQAFKTYQRTEAWTWEHLAQTRARAITGAPDLMEELEAFRQRFLLETSSPAKVLADVSDMRARLSAAKPVRARWESKRGPGGMQDIELIAQTGALLAGDSRRDVVSQIGAGQDSGWITEAEANTLRTAYKMMSAIRMAEKLLTEQALDPEAIGQGGRQFLLRETGVEDLNDLADILAEKRREVDQLTTALLTRLPPEGDS